MTNYIIVIEFEDHTERRTYTDEAKARKCMNDYTEMAFNSTYDVKAAHFIIEEA